MNAHGARQGLWLCSPCESEGSVRRGSNGQDPAQSISPAPWRCPWRSPRASPAPWRCHAGVQALQGGDRSLRTPGMGHFRLVLSLSMVWEGMMPVLPAPLSHQAPSPHPLPLLKRGHSIARGHPGLGKSSTGSEVTNQNCWSTFLCHNFSWKKRHQDRQDCPEGSLVLGHNQNQAAEGPCAKSQVGTLGNPSRITTVSSGKIPLETFPREDQLARSRGEAAQLLSDPPPPMQLLHCYWLDWSVFAQPVPLQPAALSPPQTEHAAPGAVSHHALASRPPALPLCWPDNPCTRQRRCCGC